MTAKIGLFLEKQINFINYANDIDFETSQKFNYFWEVIQFTHDYPFSAF